MDQFEFEITAQDGIARIDLNRPDEGNAMTRAMMVTLAERLREVGAKVENRVVVLAARGTHFCRGRDGTGESSKGMSAYEMRVKMMGATLGVYEAIAAVPVPVVALVQGPATGFGAAMASACDVTLASSEAAFSFPEIKHGIPPTMAMAATIRNVPPKALAYLIYSGATLTADQAVTFGLASRVFANDRFAAECETFLTELASRPRLNLETIKKYQLAAADLTAAMASEYAGTLMALVRA